ncbi:MAG TPA: nucleoside-diphosphate kinase [Candidatus Nanoarchaeia archaeon]|nr:nucleoside-diphosphate kinase [Candidatus Nanoarchaeia archaeon]
MIERTFVLLKPDSVERGLVGEIIRRFENTGLKLIAMKMRWVDKDFAKRHYTEDVAKRRGEKVRKMLIEYVTAGPVIALVLEGVHAVDLVRKLVGPTESAAAAPGTIRGDFSHHSYAYADKKGIPIKNLIHASGNAAEAKQEISLWFSMDELYKYQTVHEKHTL